MSKRFLIKVTIAVAAFVGLTYLISHQSKISVRDDVVIGEMNHDLNLPK